eukprot:CAMPEP_0117667648 /NCGR_PEP_ID=MMETSP0804-20121206/11091_1 /TAXON_ID=1074897 /ORGANISM="Tetraselmis astigmatica, Strain CCMP880" /LENGTH=80 /DNA_ID=CAMNT_0005475413 /DNA_START=437 /DNA_END=679 /DNA_ORIENTATION=-
MKLAWTIAELRGYTVPSSSSDIIVRSIPAHGTMLVPTSDGYPLTTARAAASASSCTRASSDGLKLVHATISSSSDSLPSS